MEKFLFDFSNDLNEEKENNDSTISMDESDFFDILMGRCPPHVVGD